MNWNLIMSETEDRVPLNTLVWKGVRLKLEKISEREKISLSRIVRHSINNFLKEYEKEEAEKKEYDQLVKNITN